MRSTKTRSLLIAALLALSLPVAAQKVKIENQGEAAARPPKPRALTVAAIEKTLGKAPAGKAHVVFFRAATSPGAAAVVRCRWIVADLARTGMYFVSTDRRARVLRAAETGPFDRPRSGSRVYVQSSAEGWRCAVAALERGQVAPGDRRRQRLERYRPVQGCSRVARSLRSQRSHAAPLRPSARCRERISRPQALPSTAIATANIGRPGAPFARACRRVLQVDPRPALRIELRRRRVGRLAPDAHHRLLRRARRARHADHVVEFPARLRDRASPWPHRPGAHAPGTLALVRARVNLYGSARPGR